MTAGPATTRLISALTVERDDLRAAAAAALTAADAGASGATPVRDALREAALLTAQLAEIAAIA